MPAEKDPSLELLKLINKAITIIEKIEGTSNDQMKFHLFLKTKIGIYTKSGQNNATVTHLTEINTKINEITDEDGYTRKTVGELKTIISQKNLSNTVSTPENKDLKSSSLLNSPDLTSEQTQKQDNNQTENFITLSHGFFQRMSEKKGSGKYWFSIRHGKSYQTAGEQALQQINAIKDEDSYEDKDKKLYNAHQLFFETMKTNNSKRTWRDYRRTFKHEKCDNRHINSTQRNIDEIFEQSKQHSAKIIIMGNNK